MVVAIAVVLVLVFGKGGRYFKALKLIEDGKYKEAYEILKEIEDYKDSKELLSRFRYVPVKSELYHTYGDSITTITSKATLNKKNLPSKIVYTDEDGEEGTVKFSYNSDGKLTLEEYTDGDEWHKYEYTYDSDGNLIEDKIIDSYGYWYISEYTYDSKGNITKEEYEHSDGYWSKTEYTYDSKGNEIKQYSEEDDGYWYVYEFTYDSKGNIIKKEYDSINGSWSKTEYTYDSKENLIEEDRNSSHYEYRYEYTYDSDGNMIEEKNMIPLEVQASLKQNINSFIFLLNGMKNTSMCLDALLRKDIDNPIKKSRIFAALFK